MIFYINCLYEESKHEHMINEWGCEEISVESLVVESNFELACIAAYFVQAYDIYNKNKHCAIYGSIESRRGRLQSKLVNFMKTYQVVIRIHR